MYLERVRLAEDTALKAAGGNTFAGSIPVLSARDVAQFGRALALGASGRRFKSYHPDCVCIKMLHSLEILKSLISNIPAY